jgi:hypothetical protein
LARGGGVNVVGLDAQVVVIANDECHESKFSLMLKRLTVSEAARDVSRRLLHFIP